MQTASRRTTATHLLAAISALLLPTSTLAQGSVGSMTYGPFSASQIPTLHGASLLALALLLAGLAWCVLQRRHRPLLMGLLGAGVLLTLADRNHVIGSLVAAALGEHDLVAQSGASFNTVEITPAVLNTYTNTTDIAQEIKALQLPDDCPQYPANTANECRMDAGVAAFSQCEIDCRSTQTITFVGLGNQTLGTAPPALSATASSGLPVSFSSSTIAVCTVSGTTLTLVAVGNCTINADQAGDATYAAAPMVSRTFSVAAAAMVGFANGGFETAGASTPAEAWLAVSSGYSRSADSRSGSFSALLRSRPFGSAVMMQNSVEQGGRPPLVAGTSPTLRFWAKGTAGATGHVLFALLYLDNVGNPMANSLNVFFQSSINTTTWTEITYNLGPVPVGATAALIEFSQNIGTIGTGPAGEDWFEGQVLIDDVSLQ